jgi:hypothetical protein
MNDFVTHACEQVLRFTSIDNWDDLTQERKVQLSFNMGVCSLGLGLTKQEGYDSVADTVTGHMTIVQLHEHLRSLIALHGVIINEQNVKKPV